MIPFPDFLLIRGNSQQQPSPPPPQQQPSPPPPQQQQPPPPPPLVQQLQSGREDVFCFGIDDEFRFDQLIQRWGRIPFSATWSREALAGVEEELEGVACPVEACGQDCYRDNFEVIKRVDESEDVVGGESGSVVTSSWASDGSYATNSWMGDGGVRTNSWMGDGGVTTSSWASNGESDARQRGRIWIFGHIRVLPQLPRKGFATKR